ncbi:protein FAM177A1 isoform X1 [Pygocentrus nattereri]|uniref:protein FAM177A1 isoform X1 n=1 Tax=Pygocentrus nattereri TaxID=42514 RepID=UPI000814726E|nr:protein FAM177A1 isoform X1 [Pygocentrus nattereri]
MELGSMRQSQQRKVIHFSSGETLEEDDSEEETAEQPHRDPLNKAGMDNLSWRRYAWFWGTQVMIKSLQTCDFVGGKLAGFLGLTRAKYQYAIDEYQRVQKAPTPAPPRTQKDKQLRKSEREETLLSHTETSAYGTTLKTTSEE